MENRFNFRVWDTENKNFLVKKKVNKAYDIDGNRLPVIIYSAPDFYSENTLEYCMESDGFVVMQSTGLRDVNEKLIFEKMILNNNFFVDFKNGCYILINILTKDIYNLYDYSKQNKIEITEEYREL